MNLPKLTGSSQPVAYQVDSRLGIITLQDGTGTNRLDREMLEHMYAAVSAAMEDPEVKVILMRSGEGAFCLGMNLEVLQESLENQGSELGDSGETKSRETAVSQYALLLEAIAFGPKPVIGLVEGPVKAGGVGITAACDIVVAQDGAASFELSEVLFGLIPANVLPFLLNQRITPQRARYLVLTAQCLSAQEAENFGLVDQALSRENLEKGLKTLLKTMMRAEPHALARAKFFIGEHVKGNFSTFQHFQNAAQRELLELMNNPQVKQGLDAFSDGQTPDWFHRFKPTVQLSGCSELRKETIV